MNIKLQILAVGIMGFVVGIIFDQTWLSQLDSDTKKTPLYWVAPMDPNFRSDRPGKSPMGMDLIPVYEKTEETALEKGTVRISPLVENNLGVRVQSVEKGDLILEVQTVGYISFDEEQLTHFHSRVDGWIEQLSITAEGDRVDKGQKLFELYSPELVTAQEEYLSALSSGSSIIKSASIAKLTALGVSQNQIKDLKRTKSVKQRLDFYANEKGYVVELNVRVGMFVNPATTILSIGNLDTVWVIAELFERQAAWIEVGQAVRMRVGSYPDIVWSGKIDYIYPVLDSKTRTIKARISFDNKNHRLQPNMFTEMTIKAVRKENVLMVPIESVIYTGSMARVVRSVGDGLYHSVQVVTGAQSNDKIEILKGLEAGDKVVVSAQFMLDSESNISAGLDRIEAGQSHTKHESDRHD